MKLPSLTKATRLMIIAPHPDDESLATGVLLQKAVAAGAAVRIVYVTDGDDNPWPQRALEKRWRLSAPDRVRWGKRRRREALAALKILGVRARDALFLSLPDQGLTKLLLQAGDATSRRLGEMIRRWAPTVLLLPSELDTHPDHSAVAVLSRFALDELPASRRSIHLLSYLVHGKKSRFAARAQMLNESAHERMVKRRAILEHVTQVKFSRRRFLAYAARPESFLTWGPGLSDGGHGAAIKVLDRSDEELQLRVRLRLQPLGAEPSTFYVVGRRPDSSLLAVKLRLPSSHSQVTVTDCASGHRISTASCRGDAFAVEMKLPISAFAERSLLFAKLARRPWFFDQAGWVAISSVAQPASKLLPHSEPTAVNSAV